MHIETGHIASKADGTSIGWRRLGSGPPLVVAHGSLATGEDLMPLSQALADEYTVFLYDRRGRGLSGDKDEYTLATEVADLEAVLAVAGPGAVLFGHSYGAICAAAAAAEGANISALVLCEPPLPMGPNPPDQAPFPRIADALGAGDNDRALEIIASGLMLFPDAGVAAMRQSPGWPDMVALAPTFPREQHAVNSLFGNLEQLKTIHRPTLLVVGRTTSPGCMAAVKFLSEGLPDATLAEFPDGDHFTPLTDPGGVADAVKSFLGRQVFCTGGADDDQGLDSRRRAGLVRIDGHVEITGREYG